MITVTHYLVLSALLFSIGLLGLLIRRNLLLILLSIEIMLNAANLNFVAGAALHGNVSGQVISFFVMVVAAAEVTIGLSIAVLLFRRQDSVDTREITFLKG
jgi:NADH-quinone oxidoreductase subunit K